MPATDVAGIFGPEAEEHGRGGGPGSHRPGPFTRPILSPLAVPPGVLGLAPVAPRPSPLGALRAVRETGVLGRGFVIHQNRRANRGRRRGWGGRDVVVVLVGDPRASPWLALGQTLNTKLVHHHLEL